MNNYIVLDVETGGLDPNIHSLLSVGIVFVKDNEVVDKKEWKLKHNTYNVTSKALEINDIDLSKHEEGAVSVEDFISELETRMMSLYSVTRDKTLFRADSTPYAYVYPITIGHNVAFDTSFMKAVMGREKWEMLVGYRVLDTAGIARFMIDCDLLPPKTSGSLDGIASTLGILVGGRRHTALGDAELTLKVYTKLKKLIKIEDK